MGSDFYLSYVYPYCWWNLCEALNIHFLAWTSDDFVRWCSGKGKGGCSIPSFLRTLVPMLWNAFKTDLDSLLFLGSALRILTKTFSSLLWIHMAWGIHINSAAPTFRKVFPVFFISSVLCWFLPNQHKHYQSLRAYSGTIDQWVGQQ